MDARSRSTFCSLSVALALMLASAAHTSGQANPLVSSVAWLAQVAKGQRPKLLTAPLVHFETGNRYYKIMLDSMADNFRKSIVRSSERSFSLHNTTSIKSISVATNPLPVSIVDLHIEGLEKPKVSYVYLDHSNLRLHATFVYKKIKISGKCAPSTNNNKTDKKRPTSTSRAPKNGSPSKVVKIMEISSWNVSWSANIMAMIGRDQFDLSEVFAEHKQKSVSMSKGQPKACMSRTVYDKLRPKLIDKLRAQIDSRLVEIMEGVMFRADSILGESQDDLVAFANFLGPTNEAQLNESKKKRNDNNIQVSKPKLKVSRTRRTKRDIPCEKGDDADETADNLLRFGKQVARSMEPFVLPNATIELPDYNLKIFLWDGKASRINMLRRVKPAWVYCDNETISLGITLVVDDLRSTYKYRVISGYRLLFDGDVQLKANPRLQIQFSQAKQEPGVEQEIQQRIEKIRLFRFGRVHVIVRGLGNLTQSLSMLINQYFNDNQEEFEPTFRMFEGDILKLANRAVDTVKVPVLGFATS